MLKTIFAALLAASVLAAPAFAASNGKTDAATVNRTATVKPGALNAHAKMHKDHVKHARHHTHHKKMVYRHHKTMASIKATSKAGNRPSTTGRG